MSPHWMAMMGILVALVTSAAMAQPLHLSYDRNNNRISISAVDVPIGQLVNQLKESTKISVEIDKVLVEDRMSVRVENMPIDLALRHIFRKYSILIRYGNKDVPVRVQSVFLLPRGETSPISRVVPGSEVTSVNADSQNPMLDGMSHDMATPDVFGEMPSVATKRYLEDLRPEEKALMNEVDLAAVPPRPVVSDQIHAPVEAGVRTEANMPSDVDSERLP